jgi:hypothetical protein
MVFITEAELLELQGIVDEGKDTIRTYRDTPTIQLRRRDASTGNFANAGAAFTPVKIDLADRLEQSSGANAGLVTVTNGGTMEVQQGIDIRRDDRFTVNGVTYAVTLVKPAKNVYGYRDVELTRMGG